MSRLSARFFASLLVLAVSVPSSTAAAGTRLRKPANLTLPAISGSPVQSQTLTASTGSWSGSPTSYAYSWKDCDATGANCAAVAGATAGSYVLTASDVGHTIRVAVTATNSRGSTTAQSAQTAVALAAPTAAAATVDTSPPSTPSGLAVAAPGQTSLMLTWAASTDNVGVTGYRIFQDGGAVGTALTTSYLFGGLGCGTSHVLGVAAVDAAGNTSATATIAVTTLACSTGAAASLWVSPSGSDGNPCSQAAPCLTLNHAYQLASCGSVIAAKSGSYPAQTLSAAPLACTPTTPVVVAPDSGAAPLFATITVNGPSYLTLQNLNLAGATVYVENLNTTATSCGSSYVTLDHLTANQFEGIGYICHLTVLGGSYVGTDNDSQVGPAATGAPAADTVLIDGVHFGTTESAGYRGHLETLHMWGPGLSNPHTLKNITIQNSTFDPCPQDNGSNSTTGCTNLSSGTDTLTVQNNMLNGGSPNALGLSFDSRNITYQYNSSPSSITWGNTENACTLGPNKCGPWTIRGNYMKAGYGTCAAHISPGPSGAGSDIASYAYNAWQSDGNGGTSTCGPTDVFVASLDFVSTLEGSMNLHLTSSSATAAGKGGPAPCALATDIDGQPRPIGSVGSCDAGADETN